MNGEERCEGDLEGIGKCRGCGEGQGVGGKTEIENVVKGREGKRMEKEGEKREGRGSEGKGVT